KHIVIITVEDVVIFMGINFIPLLGKYSVDRTGNMLNMLVISYATLRTNQLDITFVVRKVLAYLLVMTCVGVAFTGVIYLWYKLFPTLPFYSIVLFLSSAALLLALLAQPLRLIIQKWIDRLFYGGTQRYREELLNFASRIGNILDLDELANEMLPTMSQALLTLNAKLLVEDDKGDFTAQYTYPEVAGKSENRLCFSIDSPIVTRLGKENTPLELRGMSNIPELNELTATESQQINVAGLDLLCPIKSRGRLVGILALGRKQSGTTYTYQDIQLIMSMTGQVGLMIENAQLYSQAITLAVTDGLTGLHNHRHFHKLLEQEIVRCSRYATVLSLIILDIDLFKAFNDTFGHLAGDRILREVGECIRIATRNVDLSFRYGGEEFAVILPETPLENAYAAAERIRRTIEKKTSSEAMSVTASLGIASWPTDGVTKEAIIARADAALYLAKKTGRNKTCLSSELAKPDSSTDVELGSQLETPNKVYALAAAIDAKDHHTYGHSRKVGDYSISIAETLGLTPNKIATIRVAALLHDVGKIGMPDSILKKAGALTDEEWRVIRAHPKRGIEIVRQVIELNDCLPAILHHHEHFNGKGYPSGLCGDSIPIEARILSVADAYDALTSARHYREQLLSPQDALAELKRCSGTQFDPHIVDIFCQAIESTIAYE
ncbi:diguanylate cyclase, partial [Chloroflexota bacterium]